MRTWALSTSAGRIAGNGDFNGSGEAGLLWRNTDGDVEPWNPYGSGGFTDHNVGVCQHPAGRSPGPATLTGPVKPASMAQHERECRDLELNGSGGFTYHNLGSVNSSSQIAGTGDFSGDGADDILWRSSTNGDVELWNSNGSGGFTHDIRAPSTRVGR